MPSQIESLDLENCSITASHLPYLKSLHHLKHLRLSLNSDMVTHLKTFTRLSVLEVTENLDICADMDELKMSLKNTSVTYIW